ncbi:MAG: hypothetical protein EX269_14625 [Acidimicrobiales bacterium]|nr:MAG: hypothetical protein EX269_14625 [Acidimicrobiales bacterium]
MAITQADLDLLRNELDTRITGVTVEHVSMAQAIGSYGERFTAMDARFDAIDARFEAIDMRLDFLSQDIDRRFEAVDRRFEAVDRRFDDVYRRLDTIDMRLDKLDAKIDNRFGWQTVFMAVLGVLVLFGDVIRAAAGL